METARRLARFDLSMKKAKEALSLSYRLNQLNKVTEVRMFMQSLIYVKNEKNVMTSNE